MKAYMDWRERCITEPMGTTHRAAAFLAAVGDDLQAALDASTDDPVDRSEIIRLALRVGLKEASPETFAALQDGVQQHALTSSPR